MKPLSALLTALFAAAAFGVAAHAQAQTVFKWVDANGVTNYTTTPPPASVNKVAALNAAPAISSTYPNAANEEAQYWRERRLRESGDSASYNRQRQDAEDLRQAQVRQDMALRYDEEQRRRAEESRRQSSYDQCMRDRRVSCEGPDYGTAVIVAGRSRPRPIGFAAPFPVAGTPPVTNATPGAPSIGANVPNPPRAARPVLEPARK